MTKIESILVCALILVTMACAESSKTERNNAAKANAISNNIDSYDTGNDVQAADVPTAVEDDDGPSEPVLVHLPDLNNIKGDGIDTLEIEIEYVSNYKYDVSAVLVCNGLVNQSAKADFGKLNFSSDAIQSLFIKASDMPIQQIQGATSCKVELTLDIETSWGLKSRKMRSAAFYVKHSNDYSKLRYFDEKTLINNFGGVLSGIIDEEGNLNAPGSVMGRLKQGNLFTEITVMDDRQAVVKDGKIVGWDLGMTIASEKFEMIEMEEDSDDIQE